MSASLDRRRTTPLPFFQVRVACGDLLEGHRCDREREQVKSWVSVPLAGVAVAAGVGLAALILRAGADAPGGALPAPAPIESAQLPTRVGVSVAGAEDALMIARRSGEVLVGLAVRPGGPVDLLLFGGNEEPLRSVSVRVRVGAGEERVLAQAACGPGCFRLPDRVLGGIPVRLSVAVERPGKPVRRVSFALPGRLPPRADALWREVEQAMGALRSVRIQEVLTAGAGALRSRWVLRAPDRLSVVSSDGGKSILIGRRRWDWLDGRWVFRTYPRTRLPAFVWTGAGNPRLLGQSRVGGEPVKVLSLYNAKQSWWFRLWVTRDGRVLKAEMLAPSHFMLDRYSGFDEFTPIQPPPT